MNELNVEWRWLLWWWWWWWFCVCVCVHGIILAKISSSLSCYLKSVCSKIDWALTIRSYISKRNLFFMAIYVGLFFSFAIFFLGLLEFPLLPFILLLIQRNKVWVMWECWSLHILRLFGFGNNGFFIRFIKSSAEERKKTMNAIV